MNSYSIEELAQCVRREITLRKRVYHRLVNQGKMDQSQAIAEIEMMEAIHANLENQAQPELF